MPSQASGYDPVVGLLSAAVLLALLAMTMRRLNRSLRVFMPRPRPRDRADVADDYGLLVPVATVPTRDDADMLREVLAANGIRATIAGAPPDGTGRAALRVLVFPDDAARARDLVASR
jgi:hydroxypyruvate isomerase